MKVDIHSEGGGNYYGKLMINPPYTYSLGHPDGLLDVNGIIYSKKAIVTQIGLADDEFDA